jgi:glycosyltransferase involved in cell wall biosynthesis
VTTVVVPLAGTPPPCVADGITEIMVPLTPTTSDVAHLPSRARMAPESLGQSWTTDSFDLVVVLRAYCAPFAFGAVAETSAVVIVDVDDDDATFHDDAGEHDEASRYRTLLAEISRRAALVASVTGFGDTTAVANSVDVAPDRPSDRTPGRRVLMVGNFGYSPNVEGARWFIDEVLPLCESVDFVIVGPGSERLAPHGIGFAPDLAALYAGADVVVVPLHNGSGSRIKAIEAFAAGVPVVGTSVGLEGLDVRPGIDCLINDDPTEFAHSVCQLLDTPWLAQRLAASSLANVVPRYARTHVADEAERLLRDCLTR